MKQAMRMDIAVEYARMRRLRSSTGAAGRAVADCTSS
jgi:hypothetical protein